MKKAKEYYELYKKDLVSGGEATNKAISNLIQALNADLLELQRIRHVKFDRGIIPILREVNQKWNAIVCLFEKEYGASPIKPDGFKIFWLKQMPELEGKF